MTPVEHPEVADTEVPGAGFELAFDDYGIRDGAWSAPGVSYRWKLEHEAAGRRWERVDV